MRQLLASSLVLASLLLSTTVARAQPADQGDFVAQVLELTNNERANAGLPPLTVNSQLEDAAQSYSEVLATSGCFDHTCGPVPDFADRDEAAGYTDWISLGENLAAGYPSPEAVVAGWMASPGHRDNILSPRFTETGIGVATGDGKFRMYWTQEFGARPD
jgi:uncharacterized protein YkwD